MRPPLRPHLRAGTVVLVAASLVGCGLLDGANIDDLEAVIDSTTKASDPTKKTMFYSGVSIAGVFTDGCAAAYDAAAHAAESTREEQLLAQFPSCPGSCSGVDLVEMVSVDGLERTALAVEGCEASGEPDPFLGTDRAAMDAWDYLLLRTAFEGIQADLNGRWGSRADELWGKTKELVPELAEAAASKPTDETLDAMLTFHAEHSGPFREEVGTWVCEHRTEFSAWGRCRKVSPELSSMIDGGISKTYARYEKGASACRRVEPLKHLCSADVVREITAAESEVAELRAAILAKEPEWKKQTAELWKTPLSTLKKLADDCELRKRETRRIIQSAMRVSKDDAEGYWGMVGTGLVPAEAEIPRSIKSYTGDFARNGVILAKAMKASDFSKECHDAVDEYVSEVWEACAHNGGPSDTSGITDFLPTECPHPPLVSLDSTPIILGSLPRELMQEVVQEHRRALSTCGVGVDGEVTVKFIIAKDGSVADAAVKDKDGVLMSSLGSREANECVVDVFRGMSFPEPPGGGIVIVSYTVELGG